MNYYELLEVTPNASAEVIKNAYKVLAKKFHPDTYRGDRTFAEEKMKLLNEAIAVLGNEEKRKIYNEENNIRTYSGMSTVFSSPEEAFIEEIDNFLSNKRAENQKKTKKEGLFKSQAADNDNINKRAEIKVESVNIEYDEEDDDEYDEYDEYGEYDEDDEYGEYDEDDEYDEYDENEYNGGQDEGDEGIEDIGKKAPNYNEMAKYAMKESTSIINNGHRYEVGSTADRQPQKSHGRTSFNRAKPKKIGKWYYITIGTIILLNVLFIILIFQSLNLGNIKNFLPGAGDDSAVDAGNIGDDLDFDADYVLVNNRDVNEDIGETATEPNIENDYDNVSGDTTVPPSGDKNVVQYDTVVVPPKTQAATQTVVSTTAKATAKNTLPAIPAATQKATVATAPQTAAPVVATVAPTVAMTVEDEDIAVDITAEQSIEEIPVQDDVTSPPTDFSESSIDQDRDANADVDVDKDVDNWETEDISSVESEQGIQEMNEADNIDKIPDLGAEHEVIQQETELVDELSPPTPHGEAAESPAEVAPLDEISENIADENEADMGGH